MDHTTFTAATNCTTCHNGSQATGKPATHIPVTANCISCHGTNSFSVGARMDHNVVITATCKSCHSGAYVSQGNTGALAKPVNHIPELQLLNGAAMDCKSCHNGTSSWTSVAMNHNSSLGGGAGWCKACHATGTAYLGNMEKKALNHDSRNTLATDCSSSGCHRPLGNKGSTYRNWN
ncbi:MAG: hypothetical protein DCF26_06745 [Burkholderiales bacterium]|nr:MAG: hypothetical protein DCF26_06745 [Burkholderiales bacterium]